MFTKMIFKITDLEIFFPEMIRKQDDLLFRLPQNLILNPYPLHKREYSSVIVLEKQGRQPTYPKVSSLRSKFKRI